MTAPFDETAIMPDATAIATAKAAIKDYNDEMPAAQRAVYVNYITKLLPFALGVAFLVYLFLYVMVDLHPKVRGFLLGATGLGGWFLGRKLWEHVNGPVTGLRQHTRDRLIPQLFGFVENVGYTNGRAPRFSDRMPAESVMQYTRIEYDDAVRGRYEGTEFELCEMRFFFKAGKSEGKTFEGIVFQFTLPVPFPGEMVILRRRGKWDKILWGRPNDRHLTEIASGDRWTDDNYEVKTTNREAGVPLARANLPKLLRWLETTWNTNAPKIVLKRNDGFLFLPSTKNFFELPGNGVVLDYAAHAEPMVRELVTLIATASLVAKAFVPPAAEPPTAPTQAPEA
jgi:Protein of unknown function (DUF3137).